MFQRSVLVGKKKKCVIKGKIVHYKCELSEVKYITALNFKDLDIFKNTNTSEDRGKEFGH